MEFKFDADVPIPDRRRPGRKSGQVTSPVSALLLALLDQPIGTSAVVHGATKMASVARSAIYFGGKGWVTLRNDPEGIRVWKIAEPTKKRNG